MPDDQENTSGIGAAEIKGPTRYGRAGSRRGEEQIVEQRIEATRVAGAELSARNS